MLNSPNPLLQIENLKKYYITEKSVFGKAEKVLKGVDGISFSMNASKTFGLVGESGCGKSTLGKTILKLYEPTDGKIIFKGEDITHYKKEKLRNLRRDMQMIFQDPYASLNPRMTIFDAVKASLVVFKLGTEAEKREMVAEIMSFVGISPQSFYKYPHEMSGGQRQRVVIARAMILHPSLIVCDEPVSALDVSVRSQVLNLMKEMQEKNKVVYLFISHDLSVVRYLCDVVAVMYLGNVVELAPTEELFTNSRHPYTQVLLSSVLLPDVHQKSEQIILKGDVPSPLNPPSGCKFHTRCPYAKKECAEIIPVPEDIGNGHQVACIRKNDI